MIFFIPKGSMCLQCENKEKTCADLNFRKMKKHKKLDANTWQVICDKYKKATQ